MTVLKDVLGNVTFNVLSPVLGGDDGGVTPPITAFIVQGSGSYDGTSGVLSRTFTSESNHSGSFLIKRSKTGTTQDIFGSTILFNSSDQLVINGLTSTATFKDPTAHMHLFWNNSGAFINGTAVTGTGTYATAALTNPTIGGATNFLNAYVGIAAFGDGQSWTLSQAGELTSDNFWQINSHSFVSAGSDTFLISGKTDMAAGTDSSGNGNNFTKSGTITATNDSGTNDSGNGFGNFATPNSLEKSTNITLSNGNKTITGGGSSGAVASTLAFDSEDANGFYFEFPTINAGSNRSFLGVGRVAVNYVNNAARGATVDTWVLRDDGGALNNGGSISLTSYTGGDNIGVFVRSGKIWWRKNGTYLGAGADPDTDTNPTYSNLTGLVFIVVDIQSPNVTNLATDGGELTHSIPTGGKTLGTQNLPVPSITTPDTTGFTGNLNVVGPNVYLGTRPDVSGTSTINGNTVIWGTHARATATGFKIITASSSYNNTGTNTTSIDVLTETEGGPIQGSGTDQSQGRSE